MTIYKVSGTIWEEIFSVKSLAKAYLSDKEICIFKQLTTQGLRATKGGEYSSLCVIPQMFILGVEK